MPDYSPLNALWASIEQDQDGWPALWRPFSSRMHLQMFQLPQTAPSGRLVQHPEAPPRSLSAHGRALFRTSCCQRCGACRRWRAPPGPACLPSSACSRAAASPHSLSTTRPAQRALISLQHAHRQAWQRGAQHACNPAPCGASDAPCRQYRHQERPWSTSTCTQDAGKSRKAPATPHESYRISLA